MQRNETNNQIKSFHQINRILKLKVANLMLSVVIFLGLFKPTFVFLYKIEYRILLKFQIYFQKNNINNLLWQQSRNSSLEYWKTKEINSMENKDDNIH